MAVVVNRLTDAEIRAAIGKGKARLVDGGGLYVQVSDAGSASFRFKYRFPRGRDGGEKILTIGLYPVVTLADARARHLDAKRLLLDDIDPAAVKKARKQAARDAGLNTVADVARAWHAHTADRYEWTEQHSSSTLQRLERHIFPALGSRAIADVDGADILKVLEAIQAKGRLETARKIAGYLNGVWHFAVKRKLAPLNEAAGLADELKRHVTKNRAAPTAIEDRPLLRRILLACDAYGDETGAMPEVGHAMRLLPHLWCRPGELVAMEWSGIDFARETWAFTSTKKGREMLTPLSRQAVSILRSVERFTAGERYVFAGFGREDDGGRKHITTAALLKALKRSGFTTETVTTHGLMRAVAKTYGEEVLGFDSRLSSFQLSHGVKDALGRAYNRAQYLDDRRAMLQRWSNFLDEVKADDGRVARLALVKNVGGGR